MLCGGVYVKIDLFEGGMLLFKVVVLFVDVCVKFCLGLFCVIKDVLFLMLNMGQYIDIICGKFLQLKVILE